MSVDSLLSKCNACRHTRAVFCDDLCRSCLLPVFACNWLSIVVAVAAVLLFLLCIHLATHARACEEILLLQTFIEVGFNAPAFTDSAGFVILSVHTR